MPEAFGICVFCWGYGRLTIEHALPDWIGKRLGVHGLVEYRLGEKTIKAEPLFEVALPALCEDCNTGWLSSEFENKVARWIGPSLPNVGRSFVLDPHQREVTAAWAIKTALLLELALSEVRGSAFAPASHFEWLYEHHTPPPGCAVWTFAVQIAAPPPSKSLLAWTTAGVLVPRSLVVPKAYLATFTIGFVGFQVFGPEFNDRIDGKPVRLPLHSAVQPILQPLWPIEGNRSLRWPAPKVLAASGLETLASWPSRLAGLPSG